LKDERLLRNAAAMEGDVEGKETRARQILTSLYFPSRLPPFSFSSQKIFLLRRVSFSSLSLAAAKKQPENRKGGTRRMMIKLYPLQQQKQQHKSVKQKDELVKICINDMNE